MQRCDVVVVGGGIAGSSLAIVLAAAGIDVVVLERVEEYRDKVRGEYMQPWGAREMMGLGLDATLLEAGGGWCTRMIGYGEDTDPAVAEANVIPLDALVPDSGGGFCVGHPQASQALSAAAAARGATVVRGVGAVDVTAGPDPSVRYELDGRSHELGCRLIVGADGRHSGVRRALGIELQTAEREVVLGGMLVRTDGWMTDTAIVGVEGDRHFLAFPRPGGYVRLYQCRLPSASTSGPDRAQRMLDDYQLDSVPRSEVLATAEPAGPCAYSVGSDAWTGAPVSDGAVLIGDAAGWSDPILGCGLSVAMRDTRAVADVLLAGDEWSPEAFAAYAVERAERMRRLRMCADLSTGLLCTFTPAGRERRSAFGELMMSDALVRDLRITPLLGPEGAAAEAFEVEVLERALACR